MIKENIKSILKYWPTFVLIISTKYKNKLLLFIPIIIGSSIIQITGIFSIFPLLYVIADPSSIETNKIINIMWAFLSLKEINQYFMF